ASQSRRPARRCAIRKTTRLSGFILRLRQHCLEVVDQRLAAAGLLLGRDSLLARMAEDDARQAVERGRHLAACDFRERLAELGCLSSELGAVRKADVDCP